MALIVTEEVDPAVLFIKRRVRDGDPWSGQMALPGGFRAPDDESLRQTALREALEETGIDLERTAEYLGRLDDVSPRTPYVPPLVVTPFLFVMPGRVPVASGPEVEAAVWLPVRALLAPEHQATYTLTLPSGAHSFPSVVVAGYTIWGLTERVLRGLFELTEAPPR